MTVEVPHRFVPWDWREQPDWDAINAAVSAVFGGLTRPGLTLIEDTGSDEYVLVVSSWPLDRDEAQRLYELSRFDG